jgi:hypothetical protein
VRYPLLELAMACRTDLEHRPMQYGAFERSIPPGHTLEALQAHEQTPHLKASFEKPKQQGWSTQIKLWQRVAD